MSEQNLMVSPEKLGAEIRELTRQAKAMTLYYGVEIGRRLEAAKSMVQYGGWGAWLKENTEFSQATATRFMRVFNEYGAAQIGIFGAVPESSTLQNLSISNALRLLGRAGRRARGICRSSRCRESFRPGTGKSNQGAGRRPAGA